MYDYGIVNVTSNIICSCANARHIIRLLRSIMRWQQCSVCSASAEREWVTVTVVQIAAMAAVK